MKLIVLSCLALCFILSAQAQQPSGDGRKKAINFKALQKQMDSIYKGKPVRAAHKRWRRMEYFYASHLNEKGEIDNYVNRDIDALQQLQNGGTEASGNWQFVGPFDTEEGIGRVNCVAFIDADTWLVGSAGGGLWKTDVAGIYNPNLPGFDKPWKPLTDNNEVLSISGIAVNPATANKIFILTGDGDWSVNNDRTTEGIIPITPSVGILRTTDGGTNWETTSLVFGKDDLVSAHKLIMHPSNANKMYAATSKGLFYTDDGWATNTKLLSGEDVWDIEFHPTNSNIFYVSTSSKLYRSSNGTLTDITANIPNLDADVTRLKIAVSAAAPDNLYIIGANNGRGLEGVYLSANQGKNIVNVLDGHTLNILAHDGLENVYADGQSEYDLAFAVDPNNAAKIMVGGIGMWVSYSSGITWAHTCYEGSSSDDYVHADIHMIEFNPYSNSIVCGTDGGFWASPNGNDDTYWEKRWAGMPITQFYHFDVNNVSSYFATEIIGGAQDNGSKANSVAALLSSGETFDPINFDVAGGGDGFNAFSGRKDLFDYRYTEVQNGKIYLHRKDLAFGWTENDITPPEKIGDDGKGIGTWDTPLEVNPNEFQSILAGYNELYFSNNFGSSWSQIWDDVGPGDIKEIAWNKNNSNNIAFYKDGTSRKIVTTNLLYGGILGADYKWQTTDVNHITGKDLAISDIQFTDDAYPNNMIVTIPGYTDSFKVFRTQPDSTWKNISYNLPNVPALCAAYDEFGIYVGTDIGVFFLADKDSVWTYFSKNLPTVPMSQIEVVQDVTGRRVYCSTFGRGIWKSDPAPPKRITRYYVNKTATGANTGLSWTDAYIKVQDAIYKAIPGDTIWVAKGTYYPTAAYAMPGGNAARTYTFILDSNTVIYGGFNGTETNLSQRNPAVNETTFSGDIGVPVTATDNSYHVLTILNSTKNSFIDGFTIRDGYANGSTSYPSLYRGGAVLLAYDSTLGGRPFFKNCFFANNLAAQGGAVYIAQYFKRDAKTSFLKCTFSQNYTYSNGYGERGGALCIDATSVSNGPYGTVSLAVDSCIFQYNNSPNGAAIYNDAQFSGNIQYTINQTQFLHNKSTTASGYGGGIFNYTDNKGILNLTLNGCIFTDDDAPNAGGAIYNSGSGTLNDDDMKVYVKNCSFDSCSGYAIYSTGGKIFLSVDKSTFTNNAGGILHTGATLDGLSTGKITNCIFTNTSTGIYLACNNSGTGFTNKSINYNIDSCTFINNSYGLYLYNYSQGGNAKHAQYTLSHSTFTNNTLGAVYNFGSDNCNITATLKKNTFTNNQGTNGGAMYSYSSASGIIELYVDSCDFTGNKASASGGALYNYNTDIVSVSNCNFSNDTAATGGAVYNNATYKNALYKMDFRNCTYTNNRATGSAGALFFANGGFAGMNINVIKNTFNGNTAANYGGSFYLSSATSYDTLSLNIDSCSFNNSSTTLNTTQSHGGAIYLYAYNMLAAISHTNITNSHAKARGGAIYFEKTNVGNIVDLTVSDCNIESNSSDAYGGGLVLNSLGNSHFYMDNCTIKNNSAVSGVGGMYIYQNSYSGSAEINHTIFDGNTTPLSSGALQINADGSLTGYASNCIFKNNFATTTGGAVRLYAYDADLNDFDFNNCLFDNNTAGDNGGAAYIQTDLRGIIASKFDNSVFNNNKAAKGGTLYLTASNYAANISVPLTNCTIANNNGTIETGGIYVTKTSTTAIVHADLINTILWNNTDAGATANRKQAYVSGGATGFVKNSIIKDSIPAGYADSANNVFADPLFTNANDVDGIDNLFATTDDGYSLKAGSPAINGGVAVALSTDITGLARPQGSAYDIGAYERNGCSVGSVADLALTGITSCSLQYTWAAVAGATSYEAAYKLTSSDTWISLGDIGNVLTKTITGLTADTAYDYRVRAKKSTTCTGNWAQLLNKKTDLHNEPENPSEINITSTSAKLQWLAPTACAEVPVSYTVNGKATAGGGATTKTVTGTSFKAIGLLPSTQYTWKVSANYASGSSAYTTPRNFTTLAATAVANNNTLQNHATVTEPIDKTAALYQNIPNPFTNKTTINYSLPQQYKSAQIIVVNHTGIVIELMQLKGSGKGSVTFNAGSMASSNFQYSLFVDGKLVDTKQMISAK